MQAIPKQIGHCTRPRGTCAQRPVSPLATHPTHRHNQCSTLLQRVCLLLCLAASVALAGCGGGKNATHGPAALGAYALEGPPLFITGEYKGMPLVGVMDRHVMVGIGKMELRTTDRASGFFCESRVNAAPTGKGRIRGVLDCTEGVVLLFTLRTLGPDQGLGVGRAEANAETLVFFFHSSEQEANRRFPAILQSVREAAQQH